MKNNASPKMMLAAAFLVTGTATGFAQDKKFEGVTLQINGYGGQWDEILAEYVGKPLEEKYGLKVEFQPGGSSAAVARLIASAGNPPFDMIMVDSPSIPDLIAAGVIDEVTAEQVPNLAKVLDGKREFGGYGVPYTTSSLVVSYNKELTDVTVNSLGDLANEKLAGRVGMFNLENTGGLLYLLALAKANGGDEQNMDPAFEALQAIKPNIATVTSSTTTLNQLFDQGEIWAGTLWSGRAFAMKQADRPIETAIPAEGLLSLYSYVNPVKGTKHPEAVQAFLDQLLDDSVGKAFAEIFGNAPTTDVVLDDTVAAGVVAYGPKAQELTRTVDWNAVSENRSGWMERFNREMR